MDDAVEELRINPVFRTHGDHAENVQTLRPYFSFSLGVNKGQEAAPIVADNTMYVVTAYPNYVYALDLTQPGRAHEMEVLAQSGAGEPGHSLLRCGQSRRYGQHGKYIFNTLDGQTIAVDVKTGSPLWRTQLGNINIGETHHQAAVVADGKVYVGNSGGEMGVRGWFAALNENSGKLLWRAWNTGPDADVLIGPQFKPLLPFGSGHGPRRQIVAARSLEDWRRQHVGLGHVRPRTEHHLSRHGQSGALESGAASGRQQMDHRHLCARSGHRRAHAGTTRYSPHDEHDYDGINEQLLLDMPFAGKMHKVLIHIDRDGYIYVIDRTTGAGAVGRSVRTGEFDQGRRSADRPADPESREGDQGRRDGAQHLSDRIGREGLESRELQPRDGPALHPA